MFPLSRVVQEVGAIGEVLPVLGLPPGQSQACTAWFGGVGGGSLS